MLSSRNIDQRIWRKLHNKGITSAYRCTEWGRRVTVTCSLTTLQAGWSYVLRWVPQRRRYFLSKIERCCCLPAQAYEVPTFGFGYSVHQCRWTCYSVALSLQATTRCPRSLHGRVWPQMWPNRPLSRHNPPGIPPSARFFLNKRTKTKNKKRKHKNSHKFEATQDLTEY